MQPTYQPNRNYYRDPGFQHGRKGGGYGNYYSKKVSDSSAFKISFPFFKQKKKMFYISANLIAMEVQKKR